MILIENKIEMSGVFTSQFLKKEKEKKKHLVKLSGKKSLKSFYFLLFFEKID